jgi:hypothetical protein
MLSIILVVRGRQQSVNEPPCTQKRADSVMQTNVTGGHFLEEDIGLFDATFFNMTPEVSAVGKRMTQLTRKLLSIAGNGSSMPVATGICL